MSSFEAGLRFRTSVPATEHLAEEIATVLPR